MSRCAPDAGPKGQAQTPTKGPEPFIDPEIPLNIYDLGLIYKLVIDPVNAVKVEMTLTAPGCPVAGDIVAGALRAAGQGEALDG